ncbi:hypothetical protein CKO51_21660 [Rhodopirellula sp. SM50]|nr:hypothetical protein CKO51_21660 [Rhodopirellula sp. SM50]
MPQEATAVCIECYIALATTGVGIKCIDASSRPIRKWTRSVDQKRAHWPLFAQRNQPSSSLDKTTI